jgi:hypothetical protein
MNTLLHQWKVHTMLGVDDGSLLTVSKSLFNDFSYITAVWGYILGILWQLKEKKRSRSPVSEGIPNAACLGRDCQTLSLPTFNPIHHKYERFSLGKNSRESRLSQLHQSSGRMN